MIRRAKMTDLAAVGQLVKEAWEMTHDAPVNEDKLRRCVHQYMSGENRRIWVSDIDGEVKGMLAAGIDSLDVVDGYGAYDSCFYCKSGEGQGLIKKYVNWAKSRKCLLINMSVSSGSDRAGRVIESKGFKYMGGNYYHVESSQSN